MYKKYNISERNRINDRIVIAIGLVAALLIVWAIVFLLIFNSNVDITVPLSNQGGDETSYLSEVKLMLENNTLLTGNQIAAPFGTNRKSTISYYLFNDVHFISYVYAKITCNVGLAVNLTFITLFFLSTITAYLVMVSRGVDVIISILGTVLFSLQSYVFWRGTGHLMLSAIEMIPLAILLSLWIYEDDNMLCWNKSFFCYKRNILSVVFSLLIVNSGIGYYMAFACFFIVIAGVVKSIEQKKLKGIVQSIFQIVIIVLSLIVSLSRYIFYRISHVGSVTSNIRSLGDVEVFSLKIARLFIPTFGTNIKIIDQIFQDYAQVAVCQTETTEYIGIVGLLGFIVLILIFLGGTNNKSEIKDLNYLSRGLICALLYATIGGFEVFVFLFLTDMVRCTNRISVFIAYICILAACLFADLLLKKQKKGIKKILIYFSFGVICIVSLKYQLPAEKYTNVDVQTQAQIQKEFIAEIEERVPDEAMIFQLPYQDYPTGGFVNEMMPNALFIPYIYSNTLRWSYGALPGEKSQIWNQTVSSYDVDTMISNLCYADFSGIYIESKAYSEKELEDLENEIEQLIGKKEKIVSSNGQWIFYDLTDYKTILKQSMSSEEWELNVEKCLAIVD